MDKGRLCLDAARHHEKWLTGLIKGEDKLFHATLVTAYSTLAIAEKMYEEKDVPDLGGADNPLYVVTHEGVLK